jgi:putative transferase (TIGR04331 family)
LGFVGVSKEKRYLIATADERAWKFDRPVVFLGEWCRLYDRKHVWESMNAEVPIPYGLGREQKDKDYLKVKKYEGLLFPIVCDLLNKYHSVTYSERFWKILIGHWFRRYLQVMINRIATIDQCLKMYSITGMTVDSNFNTLAPRDSNSAVWAFSNDAWNNNLIKAILKKKGFVDNFFQEKALDLKGSESLAHGSKRSFSLSSILRFSLNGLDFLRKNTDAVICNSYLPSLSEVKLNFALKQIPRFGGFPLPNLNVDVSKIDREKYSRLCVSKVMEKKSNDFDICIASFLFDLIPVCYWEGFAQLKNQTLKIKAPSSPKFIFTSNSFDSDEIFKLWTALKTEDGTPYIVGQHGNNYGTSRYMNPSVEEETSDKFITWGWVDSLKNHVPAFIFKTINKNWRFNPIGGMLLIEVHLNHRISTWDDFAEFSLYFEDQKAFVSSLNPDVKENLVIRLHSSYRHFSWNEISRWFDFDSSLKIDHGNTNIVRSIKSSRLTVFSYDSTGILELLSLNVPMMAFWQNGFEHLRDDACQHYKLLVDVGIVHFSAESVSKKINEIWSDIDTWWNSDQVQLARKDFCNVYAKNSTSPIAELIQILEN